jgi:hypothetical protein
MGIYYNSETLIESVKRRINIPTNQNTFTDADILAFADEEMALGLVPAVMSLHEDHLLFQQFSPLVENQREYEIPYRAVGNKLYDLMFEDSNGNFLPMSHTTWSDEPNYNGAYTTNLIYAYYVRNNRVGLLPTMNGIQTGSLCFRYYIRPSGLVPSAEVAVITSIDLNTGTIIFSNLPDTFNTNTLVDFYKFKSPHTILAIDVQPTSVSVLTNTMIFNPDDIPEFLAVGDHVALAEQCCIPQVPSDLHVYLAQKTAERILESQGDAAGLQAAKEKSREMEFRAGTIIDNRVDESPVKLVNRHGILRSGLIQRLYRRRG